MAALQRLSTLQNNSLSRYPTVKCKDSRSFISSSSNFYAFKSATAIPGSCISRSSLSTRSRIPWLWRARAGGEGGADSSQEKGDNNSATTTTSVAPPGEPKLGGAAKGFGAAPKASATVKKKPSKSSPPSSGSIRRTPPSKPLIGVSAADQQTQQVETAVVASLAFLLALIFLEGVILAGSGFLPEEWDEFAVNSIYPAFTPSVGVFLAIAASYGLWKALSGGKGTSSK